MPDNCFNNRGAYDVLQRVGIQIEVVMERVAELDTPIEVLLFLLGR
jgi:hypothetical protein